MRRALTAVLLLTFCVTPAISLAVQVVNVDSFLATNQNDPLAISNVTLSQAPDQQGRVCFTFMNLTSESVTSAEFLFSITDQFGTERYHTTLIRNANSGFDPGQTVNPPDVNDPSYQDVEDGSQSCWVLSNSGNVDLQGLSSGMKISVTVLGLVFADGSKWQRGQQFARAYNYDGSQYVYTPIQFDTDWSTVPNTAPIAVVGASLTSAAASNNTGVMNGCVSFRNVSGKVATGVRFSYSFSDANGSTSYPVQNWTDTGTFTPPILIEDHCWQDPLPADNVVRSMRHEVVRVVSVTFSDGSQWSQGQQWFRAYTDQGYAYNGQQVEGGGGGGVAPAPPAQLAPPANNAYDWNSSGVTQLTCVATGGGTPFAITIDKGNSAASETILNTALPDYGQRVTARAYFSQSEITWTWPVEDRNGNVLQDSWVLNRATLQANEDSGQYHYQCRVAPQNQI